MAIDDCVNSMTALRLERVRLMEHEKDLNRRWGETVDAFDRAYAQGQTTGDADRDFVLRAWREDNGALAGAWGRFREAMDAHVGEIFLLAVYREFSARWKYYCGVIRHNCSSLATPWGQSSSVGTVENINGIESVAIFLPVNPYMAYQDYSAGIGKSAFNNGNFGIGQKDLREYLLYGDSNAGVPIHLSDVAQDKLLWIAVGNDAVENFCRTAQADFLRWLDDVKVILGLTTENRSRA